MSAKFNFSARDMGDDNVILSETGVFQFKIGMKVQVDYVNPTGGWTVIWLEDFKENVVLSFSARVGQKELILNSKEDGKWGDEEKPDGYNFTPGVRQSISLEAEHGHFTIRVNDHDLHHFKYRLPPTSIHKVVVHFKKYGTAEAPQLQAVAYKY